jgi:hypothetical protein
MHSSLFGSHILGAVKSLAELVVTKDDDIDRIVDEIIDQKLLASQVRLLVGKVFRMQTEQHKCTYDQAQIPLPGCPPVPLAVLPTQGKDTAEQNADLLMRARAFCAKLKIPVIAVSSDGAANEVAAHDIINNSRLATKHLVFSIERYGFHVRVPIFPGTGPLVNVPDNEHLRKVLRNNVQSGTHTLKLGKHYLGPKTLVQLYEQPGSGMQKKDAVGGDKQDDGAVNRLFHSTAQKACLDSSSERVDPRFIAAFTVHFVFGRCCDLFSTRTESACSRTIQCIPQ